MRYTCNAGGHNWRRDVEGMDFIDVKCTEEPGNVVDWAVPDWPTCANGK